MQILEVNDNYANLMINDKHFFYEYWMRYKESRRFNIIVTVIKKKNMLPKSNSLSIDWTIGNFSSNWTCFPFNI